MNLAKCATMVCVGAMVTGCASQRPTDPRKDDRTISPTVIDKPIEGQAKWGEPIVYPHSSVLLVPLTMINEKGWLDDKDPWSPIGIGGSSSGSTRSMLGPAGFMVEGQSFSPKIMQVRWHNAIARDLRTGEEWPILPTRGVISDVGLFSMTTSEPSGRALLSEPIGMLFLATLEDTNGDGFLTKQDARVAFLTDKEGRNPRTISPTSSQITETRFLDGHGVVVLMVRHDSNRDRRFDIDDEVEPYIVDLLSTDRTAKPLVSDEAKRKAEGLLK